MTSRTLAKFALVCALALPVFASARIAPATGHSFRVEGDHFAARWQAFPVLAGEMHYARMPREYWRDRLAKAKAMGLNTITTYVFWNVHEPQPGVYDFTGNNDVAEFIREAQQEGLYVILGPARTLRGVGLRRLSRRGCSMIQTMVVRGSDPKFLRPRRAGCVA